MFGRSRKPKAEPGALNLNTNTDRGVRSMETERTLTEPTKAQVKRATRTRFIWTLLASFLLLLSVIFMILVEIGSTDANKSALNKIYFIRIDLSNIIPTSVANAAIINSIAQTIGLHDYYYVGLWGYCEAYKGQGVTGCSDPEAMYWFNPVEIILSELLSGATITLPAEVTSILHLIKVVSHWMFGLFLSGVCLAFVMMFLQPISIFSRWWAFLVMIFTFLAALFITVATVVATVMFIIMRNAFTSVAELNIGAMLGTEMFVFMWIASATAILAWLIQLCLCCCCASRRDVRSGRKRGSMKAWKTETVGVNDNGISEKPKQKRGIFGRRRSGRVN